jgi:anaerobic magnesium-protoporphyrin IX monomethyl ester cyclase
LLKVVLINPRQSTGYSQPPIGLAIIAAVLEQAGYPISIVDANVLRLGQEEIAARVAGADVVGITAMTPTINAAVATARHLKKVVPNLTIMLGGPHATLLPDETLLNAPEIDVVVRGESEGTVVKVLQALEHKQPLSEVQGISFRNWDKVVNNPAPSDPVDLDAQPFLAYHLLPWRKYRPHPPHGRALPFAAIITSRGCPYRCTYCSKPVFGNKFRGQSPERVVKEIAYYRDRFGIKELAFYDDVFTLDKKRAYAIADDMLKAGLKICWTCETRVNLVDKELLAHMKRAGCYAIAYGIESASAQILNTLHKDITLEQVEEAIRTTREAGIQTIGYLMLGSPGETPETIDRTINLAKKLRLDFAQFSITMPLPGSEMYNQYLKQHPDPIRWEDFAYSGAGAETGPVFESEKLSRAELARWVRKAYREFYLRPDYIWQRLLRTTSPGDFRVNLSGVFMFVQSILSR